MTEKRIALVTGANKGIGFEIARGLGAAGLTVLVGARSPERGEKAAAELREAGLDARFLRLDVTDEESVEAAVKVVEAEFGRLDVLVNNAGILSPKESWIAAETPVAALREVYEVNVFGVVAVTKAMIPLLRAAPAARVVNVSSELGSFEKQLDREGPFWEFSGVGYPSSKAALNMITVGYAKYFRDTPVLVNAVNPGYCATDLNGNSGHRTAEEGSRAAIRMALLDEGGPTGAFVEEQGELGW
ncbi:SDR family oxidoreductase [Actinorhabdospora filicis]|nr:SDR family oxidoreductase [Actinorhabdospora filicis]